MKKIFLSVSVFLMLVLMQTGFVSKGTGFFSFVSVSYADESENSIGSKNEDLTDDKENKDKLKIIKNLNTILVDSYKTKLDQILDILKDNIKDESKENQIKTFSNILIPINLKIKTIETKKEIGVNRKEVLIEVLKHIKKNLEADIKELLDSK
ncbi:MAG: hypothetical protein PHS92_04080 [Candidatus Gracilibacteria bacterium]|nr:hypothetical protein [Candidatus Gracilibacteria bacterium]